MGREDKKDQRSKMIGQELSCDPSVIDQALQEQRRLAEQGQNKLLGEILLQSGQATESELELALHRQRLNRLANTSIFSGTTFKELEKISHWVSELSIKTNEQFICQDVAGSCFFILASGQAEVFMKGDYDEETLLAKIGPGESIGELGYFAHGRRIASVRALERCELLQIKYDDLEILFKIAPTLSKNFLDLVTERLRQTNIRFQDISHKQLVTEKSLASLSDFLDLSELTTLSEGIEGLIERVVLTASKVMDADRASLFILDVFAGELWSKVAEGVTHKEIRISLGQGIVGWVAQNDEFVSIPDAYLDERFDPSHDMRTGYQTRNILCGPVKNLQGEIVGAIQVINKLSGSFDERDESLFRAFAYQTAITLENFSLYRRLVSNHEQMAILLDISNAVSQTLDLDALIIKIVNKISQILDAERSSLFMLDQERGELWSQVALGENITEIRFPSNIGLAGHVVQSGELLNIQDAYQDERFNPAVDRETGYHTRNLLTVPVRNRDGQIIGVTQAINKKGGVFETSDEHLLTGISSQIAVALENAKLYRRTVRMKDYLSSIQDSITNSIITLNNELKVGMVNRAACEFFQQDIDQLVNQDFRELIGSGNERLLDLLIWVHYNRRALVDYDQVLVLPDGRKHTVNVNLVPLIDPNEEHEGLVLVLEDITREKRIKATMSRYMARTIIERLLEDPSRQALGGVYGKASIMFTDIEGFTGIAEGMSAVETVEFLNEYFSLMVDVVFENEGVLDKYIGDAIMAVFGVPYPREDDSVRAVRTSLQMRNTLNLLNARRMEKAKDPIKVGIGVCTGYVVSGNIGSEKRMDYTVIGDGVNIAARLEALTRFYGAGILISESTWQEIKDLFTTRPVDKVIFKGKKHPVQVFEVLGEGDLPLTAAEKFFVQGLELYRQKDFHQALKVFNQGQKGDKLCQVFLKRCHYFIGNPPPDDWDGAWITSEK